MRTRNVVRVALCLFCALSGLVQGHQYKWRITSTCPGGCSCGSYCSGATCSWASNDNWLITTCEPAFCNICPVSYPDDSGDDALIENWTGTHTLNLSSLTIDGFTVTSTSGTATNITFESASSNNLLAVDFFIIDGSGASGSGDITLTIQDGASIIAS